MNSAAAAVVPPTGSADRSASRLAMSGWRKASLMSALIFAAIACGVFGGATTANQADDTNPGSVSAIVGISGNDVMRCSVPTAINFNWPPCTSASDTPRLSNMMSTSPATSPCRAGAEPRYGTFTNLTFASIWNIAEVRCEVVPLPWVAEVILPGFARANAMNCGTVLAVIFTGLTTRAFGTIAITEIGTNASGSKPSFGYRF